MIWSGNTQLNKSFNYLGRLPPFNALCDVRFGSTLKHEDNGQFRCDTFSIHQRNIDDEFLEQMEKMCNQKPDIYFEYVQKSVE